jgi:acyl-CoA dehydrogenase
VIFTVPKTARPTEPGFWSHSLADIAVILQAQLMIDWCAGVINAGSLATVESSMTKVAVSEGLMRVADRCVQVMGGSGLTEDTIVAQIFREIRAFRIYDGPTEVHKWSLARTIKRNWQATCS